MVEQLKGVQWGVINIFLVKYLCVLGAKIYMQMQFCDFVDGEIKIAHSL